MKRITYLVWDTTLNGGNKVIFTHCNKLTQRGFSIRVVSVTGQPIRWYRLLCPHQSILSYIHRPTTDILVATFWPTAYLALLLPAAKKFYFVQNWEPSFYQNPILRFFAGFTYRFPFQKITISTYLKTMLSHVNQDLPIEKIPCAVDDVYFQKHGIIKKNKQVTILAVITKYTYYKGVDYYRHLLKMYKKTHPHYRWVVASTEQTSPDPLVDEFISNPTPKLLARLYQTADVFIHTSRVEGFPLPPLEAMASGCPVVALNSGGVEEYAVNNHNALIVSTIEKILSDNLIDTIIHNQKLRQKLIAHGQEIARSYTWDKITDQLRSIYNKT